MKQTTGYETDVVIAFLDAHGERNEQDRMQTINGTRVIHTQRDMIQRWEAGRRLIPLGALDRLLMDHGMMLYELDHWAMQHLGRNGWVDPYEDPAELVG